MAQWNVEKHDVVLDPGQSYEHHMEGPTGIYDFQKYWRPDAISAADEFYNNIPSKTRFLFAVMRTDLCSSATGVIGRLGIPDLQTLTWEYRKHFKLLAPEQSAGSLFFGTTPTLPVNGILNFDLAQRRDCYWHKNYAESNQLPVYRVDELTASDNLP